MPQLLYARERGPKFPEPQKASSKHLCLYVHCSEKGGDRRPLSAISDVHKLAPPPTTPLFSLSLAPHLQASLFKHTLHDYRITPQVLRCLSITSIPGTR